MTTYTDAADAIARSISHRERTTYVGMLASLRAEATAQGYQTDHATELSGVYDVWGWTDETPEGQQDWRVRVISGEGI